MSYRVAVMKRSPINRLHQGYGCLSSSSEVAWHNHIGGQDVTVKAVQGSFCRFYCGLVESPSLFKHKEIIESKLKSLLRSHLERRKQLRRFPDVIPVVLFEGYSVNQVESL